MLLIINDVNIGQLYIHIGILYTFPLYLSYIYTIFCMCSQRIFSIKMLFNAYCRWFLYNFFFGMIIIIFIILSPQSSPKINSSNNNNNPILYCVYMLETRHSQSTKYRRQQFHTIFFGNWNRRRRRKLQQKNLSNTHVAKNMKNFLLRNFLRVESNKRLFIIIEEKGNTLFTWKVEIVWGL